MRIEGAPVSCRRSAVALLLLPLLAASLAACGGSDGLMSRQEFVDNLERQGGEVLNENIASCMYDLLGEQPEAREAVLAWEEGQEVPEELLDLAVACLRDVGEDPGS